MNDLKEAIQYKILRDIKRLSKLQRDLFSLESDKFGLTKGEYSLLFTILNNPGITLTNLSGYLMLDKSITTRTIKKLLKNNFIEKRQDISDKRSYKLYLNETNIEFIDSIKNMVISYSNILLYNFSKEEKLLFENFLDRSLKSLSQKY